MWIFDFIFNWVRNSERDANRRRNRDGNPDRNGGRNGDSGRNGNPDDGRRNFKHSKIVKVIQFCVLFYLISEAISYGELFILYQFFWEDPDLIHSIQKKAQWFFFALDAGLALLVVWQIEHLETLMKAGLVMQIQDLQNGLLNGEENGDDTKKVRYPWWMVLAFFFVEWIYVAFVIGDGFTRFINWYMNRNAVFMTHNYMLNQTGYVTIAVVSFPVVLLFWLLVHKSRAFRSVSAVMSLVMGVMSVAALAGLTSLAGGLEAFQAMVQEEMTFVTLPDWEVLCWGLPAAVLAYYGQFSKRFSAARVGRWLAYTSMLLSATIVCGILRTVSGLLFGFLVR